MALNMLLIQTDLQSQSGLVDSFICLLDKNPYPELYSLELSNQKKKEEEKSKYGRECTLGGILA